MAPIQKGQVGERESRTGVTLNHPRTPQGQPPRPALRPHNTKTSPPPGHSPAEPHNNIYLPAQPSHHQGSQVEPKRTEQGSETHRANHPNQSGHYTSPTTQPQHHDWCSPGKPLGVQATKPNRSPGGATPCTTQQTQPGVHRLE